MDYSEVRQLFIQEKVEKFAVSDYTLTMELREWYMKAAKQFDWSKTELTVNIAANAHENTVLANEDEVRNAAEKEGLQAEANKDISVGNKSMIHYAARRSRKWWLIWKGYKRRNIMSWELFSKKRIIIIRC